MNRKRGKKGRHVKRKNVNPLEKKHSCIGEILKRWSWRFLIDLFWYSTVALNRQLQNGPEHLLVECHDFLLDPAKIKAAVFQASSRPSEGETAHQTPTSSVFAIKQRKKRPQRTWKKHKWDFSCSCVSTIILVRKKTWQIWFLCRNYLEHFKRLALSSHEQMIPKTL